MTLRMKWLASICAQTAGTATSCCEDLGCRGSSSWVWKRARIRIREERGWDGDSKIGNYSLLDVDRWSSMQATAWHLFEFFVGGVAKHDGRFRYVRDT